MSASIYSDKNNVPDQIMLYHDLRDSRNHFDEIKNFIINQYGEISPEWKHYGKNSGWLLKMINHKRNVMFVVPCHGYFKVAFTFGDKASQAIFNSSVPKSIKDLLAGAKKHVEGRTIQFEVKSKSDCLAVQSLIQFKLNK